MLTPDPDIIGWWDWMRSPAVGSSVHLTRQHLIEMWTMANGKLDPDDVIEDILAGTVTPYAAGLRLLAIVHPVQDTPDDPSPENMAPATVSQYITMLGGEGKKKKGFGFLLSVLGETNFSVKKFSGLVPTAPATTLTEKKVPTVEEHRHMLRSLANPRDRALLGVFGISGWREGEIVRLKMSQLERRADGHAAVGIRAIGTKSRYSRKMFLTKEVVEWIDNYHINGNKDNPWVFPGEPHKSKGDGRKVENKHLDELAAYRAVKDLFAKAGLHDGDGYIYSPHSYRTFADSQMAKCGLDRKYIALIIGHKSKLGAEESYKDWDAVEAEWLDKCAEKMTWLTETITIVKEDPRVEQLAAAFEEILSRMGKVEGMSETIKKLRKMLPDQSKEPKN